jgi:osmotically-inducible protein OsmY
MHINRFLLAAASLGFLAAPISSHLQSAVDETPGKITTETKQMVPMQRTDEEITKGVKDAFAANRAFSPFKIDVKSKDGVVTLTGNVDSEVTKLHLGKTAKTVAGVKEVVNDIVVSKPAK